MSDYIFNIGFEWRDRIVAMKDAREIIDILEIKTAEKNLIK